jgi:hypothetical protein
MGRSIFFLFTVGLVCSNFDIATSAPAVINDSGTILVARLFSDACLPRIGKPNEVRAWATAKGFPEIKKNELLDALVGPGGKGAAWLVPTSDQNAHLALSIRGQTEGCAVWAEQADPDQARAYFSNMVEGIARPGITVKREPDQSSPLGRAIMYEVGDSNRLLAYEFLLIISEKPGTLFRVNMQVSSVAWH